MLVNPTTLSNLLDHAPEPMRVMIDQGQWMDTNVLIEHGRCGALLGVHKIYLRRGPDPELHVATAIDRHLARTEHRGPMTAPCVLTGYGDASRSNKYYAFVSCTCLPPDHEEKVSEEKLGELPVTFPDWKWGRPIDLPVVTI